METHTAQIILTRLFLWIHFDFSGVSSFTPRALVVLQAACSALGVVVNILGKVSVLTVAAVAFDRHQAIINCLKYSTMFSTSYVIKGLIWIWIQSVGFSLPPVFGWSEFSYQRHSFMCTVNWNLDLTYTVLVLACCFILPVSLMSYCYIRIIQIARRHMRRIADINTQLHRGEPGGGGGGGGGAPSHVDPRGALALAMVDPIQRLSLFPQLAREISQHGPSGVHRSRGEHAEDEDDNISNTSTTNYLGPNLKREARATLRLLGLILFLAVSWLPYFLVVTKDAIGKRIGKVRSPGASVTVTTWMFLLASAINPVIYALGSRKFRNAVRRLWRKRRLIKRKFLKKQNQDNESKRTGRGHPLGLFKRSLSAPATTTKTVPQTDTETDPTPPQPPPPPVIILSPLEELTTSPRRSVTSGVSSHVEIRQGGGALPEQRNFLTKLPPLRHNGDLGDGTEQKNMQNDSTAPCSHPEANNAAALRRSISLT